MIATRAAQVDGEVVEAAKDLGKWAVVRSIVASFINDTGLTFKLGSVDHSSGGFGSYLPDDAVNAYGYTVFNSHTTGIARGTVGYVDYAATNGALTARIQWSNPFFGKNKCRTSLSGPLADAYEIRCVAGSGNNRAKMRYILSLRESSRFMDNVDLYGSDYANFPIEGDNPGICQQTCMGDGQCLAWTYVKPNTFEPNARCWLKNAIPGPEARVETISGIK
jgi:hypothetical protein